jgi:hypothetical protein
MASSPTNTLLLRTNHRQGAKSRAWISSSCHGHPAQGHHVIDIHSQHAWQS